LLVVSLSGQSAHEDAVAAAAVRKLNSTLIALKDATASRASRSQEIVDEMMSLAKSDCPPRPVITRFADKLTNALVGRKLNEAQMTMIQRSIVEVLRGLRTSNLSLADCLQETLTDLGISPSETRLIITDFIAVGEAVRGPDDTPLIR
jgi:predicted nucleic acid-binding protein